MGLSRDLTPGRVLGRKRRPKVPGGRPHPYTVHLSDDEQRVLLARCEEAGGITVQAYLVESALSDQGTPAWRWALLAELFRWRQLLGPIASNINQAAKALHVGDVFPVESASAAYESVARLAAPGGLIDTAIERVSSGQGESS